MTILITGGAGFIGSHLCEWHTARGQHVTVLDDLSSGKTGNLVHPERVTLVEGDVADAALVATLAADAEVVYHLAAIASVPVCTAQPERATRTNVAGCQAVFDAVAAAQKAKGRTIPVVYASSAAIYGDNPNIPLSETEPPAPINLYGNHKLENERIAARALAAHNIRSVGLRFFNVYGPRQDPSSPYSGVISKFIERARAGQTLTIFGDGEQCRDFVYVADVVAAILASARFAANADAPATQAMRLNVCTGNATSLKQLADVIGVALQRAPLALDFQPPRDGDIRRSLGNPGAVMHQLQLTRWTKLLDGLTETLDTHA